jgi:pimeloyl-ACP methyl ester carboxylesterase
MTRYVICIMIDAAKIDAVRENLSNMFDVGVSPVERRHVIYVSGYDPRGAQGYFDLFRRTCQRFERLWPVSAKLKPIEVASEDFAHWGVDLRGPHWRTTTQLDFLRLENFIRSDMEKPTGWQVLRALGWFGGDLLSGTLFRIFAASWRFGLHLLYFQSLLLAWLAAAVIVAFATGHAARTFFDWSAPASMAVSLLTAFATLVALRPFADRWRVVQISSCWKTLRRFGRGQVTWIDRAVDIGARHLIAVARASKADELVVVGHSTGGVIAAAIVDRALELDPHLGRNGARLVLLTLGSVMPAVALHPAAQRMRNIVARLATAPALDWIDCQSRKDVLCFAKFDPVDGIGLQVGHERCNPLLWQISFKDMIAPDDYNRFRWNHFRVHYQYIMAGDRPAHYDYVLLVGGPKAIAEWPQRGREFMAAFMQEAAPQHAHQSDDLAVSAS